MPAVWAARFVEAHLSSTELTAMSDPLVFFDVDTDEVLELLTDGEIEVEGRMPHSSNATLLVEVVDPDDADRRMQAIYKPGRGERPLWDFPPDLYKREAAMYRLAAALGWDVVPPTTIRLGPFGEGSIQAFVDADFAEHYFTLHEAVADGERDDAALDDLRKLCVLDLLANNTDRKSGHCLLGRNGRIYGIDHGLAFHAQWKLRTVMWDFVGEPIPAPLLEAVEGALRDGFPAELLCLLDPLERDALETRARAVVEAGEFPADDTDGHRYPWPLV